MSGRRAIVVGGGMAGLACAVSLRQRGFAVTLLEAAPALGGRTRSFSYRGVEIDNGQHLLLSAYDSVYRLFDAIGADHSGLRRLPFRWSMYRRGQADTGGKAQWRHFLLDNEQGRAALLRQLLGIAGASSWRRAPFFATSLLGLLLPAARRGDAERWLIAKGQSEQAIDLLWRPLCLAALNTPLDQADASGLQAILRRVLPQAASLGFVFNRQGLSKALVAPCEHYLRQRHAQIHTGARVSELIIDEQGRAAGARSRDGREWSADTVVLSMPAPSCQALLRGSGPSNAAMAAIADSLGALECSPINTLYLQFADSIGGREAMFGFSGERIDWVIDREIVNGQRGLLALVSSARAIEMPVDGVLALLGGIYGDLPPLLWHKSIQEKCATFLCTQEAQRARPAARTGIPGLWLNGDWISNPLPATIETAVENGLGCASQIAKEG